MTETNKTKGLLLGGALASALAFGAQPARAEVDLTFAHFLANKSTEAPNVVDAIARFREKYPDVNLDEQISGTDEYLTQFNVGAASGSVPDVFMMNGSDVDGLSAGGLVGDISDALTADAEWNDINTEAMLTEFTRDGKIYGMPYGQIITHVIFWNENLFAEAGIETFPDSWDGFLEAIDKLKESGVTPIALGNKGRWVVVDPLFGTLGYRHHGTEFLAGLKAGEAKFTDPEFVGAIEDFKELVDRGAFNDDANSLDNKQQRSIYTSGDAAMFIEGSWAIPTIISDAPEEVLEATQMAIWPTIEGGQGEPNEVTGGAGWAYAISSKLEGEQREAAINLVKELSNVDYGRSRVEIGLLPAQALGEKADDIEQPRLLKELTAKVGDGTWQIVPIMPTNLPRSFLDVSGEALQDLMVGNKTPMEVAESIQKDFDRSSR